MRLLTVNFEKRSEKDKELDQWLDIPVADIKEVVEKVAGTLRREAEE